MRLHSASDAAPALIALDARVVLRSHEGERELPISEIYRADGADYLSKRDDEILTRILLPAASDEGQCRSAFWKLRRRGSIGFAVLSVAASVWVDGDHRVRRARMVLGAGAPRPLQVTAAEEFLVGKLLDREAIAEASRLARKLATPMDNTDFSTQWRGLMVERYAEAVLAEIAGLELDRLDPPHPDLVV